MYHPALFERMENGVLQARWISATTHEDADTATDAAVAHCTGHPEHFENCEAIAVDADNGRWIQSITQGIVNRKLALRRDRPAEIYEVVKTTGQVLKITATELLSACTEAVVWYGLTLAEGDELRLKDCGHVMCRYQNDGGWASSHCHDA